MAKLKYTKQYLESIVNKVTSYRQVVEECGLKQTGGNNSNIKKLINDYEINTSHFPGKCWNKGRIFLTDISHILVKNFRFSTGALMPSSRVKELLFKHELKKKECEECGIIIWNGKPAPLQLHHIDGDSSNNEYDNLQILCANCHALTDNFAGKNKTKCLVGGTVYADVLGT